MPKRSLLQIQESLRRKLSELYEVPIHDIMLGAELDPKKITEPLRRAPGLYGSPNLPQNAAGVAYAAGRISGGKPTGRVEPNLGIGAPPAAPVRPSNISKNQWKKLSADQKQALADKASAPTANAPKTSTRTDSEIVDKPTFTSPQAWYKKLATEKGVDAAEKYRTYYTGSTGNEKLPSWGSRAYTAGKKTGTAGALGYGAYELFKPDGQKPDQEKPADQPPVPTNQTPPAPPVATDQTPPAAPKPDARTQSALPQGNDHAAQDVKSPATDTPEPPPNKPYPPGTKFGDEILETYNKVLNRYRDFLNEETEQQRQEAERLRAIQRGIYGQESRSGKARTDRPNYAGALGPMQIMPKTFQWMKDTKIIPKDFDIKNPEQNREAGNALIAHYYKKYEGDPAKVAAAYYAGPGAIRKDGTINTHWRDRKNPKAPDVGQYINQTLNRAGLSDVTYTAAQPNAKPDTKLATAPAPIAPVVEPTPTPADITPTAKARVPFDSAKFDYDAFYRAVDTGQDWSDLSKFTKTATAGNKPSVSERYERYKQTQDNH